jgi:NitT/TauT family transport system substrate-binding protein
MRKFVGVAAVAVVSALAVAGCGGDDSAGGLTSIKVGYPSDTASYGDLYVCEQEGIFADHGLKVELTLLKTSSQLLAALTSGSVQVAGGDGAAVASGALADTDLKVVELKLPVYFTEMWGGSSIGSVEDLVGKKVGVTAPGSVTDTSTRVMLADKGLDDDVEVVNLASLPALMAAGQTGSVDALVTAPPQGASTQAYGWHKITDMTNYKTAASVYTVSGGYAKDHAKDVAAFVDADVECLNFLKDPANRDASVKAIAKYTDTEDLDLAGYGYDFFAKIWSSEPVVDEALWGQTMAAASDDGQVPDDAADFVDNSFVNDAIADQASSGTATAPGQTSTDTTTDTTTDTASTASPSN